MPDFRDLAVEAMYDYLVAIQVFQHGVAADGVAYFARAAGLLRSGGLLFLRVNSAATEIYFRHTVVERSPLGGLTIRYDEGPKEGLHIHFYTREELLDLTRDQFRLLAGPHEDLTDRLPPKTGRWAQWQAVWQRR